MKQTIISISVLISLFVMYKINKFIRNIWDEIIIERTIEFEIFYSVLLAAWCVYFLQKIHKTKLSITHGNKTDTTPTFNKTPNKYETVPLSFLITCESIICLSDTFFEFWNSPIRKL